MKKNKYLSYFFISLPIIMLLLNLRALLIYGVDQPFFDDWKVFADEVALSFEPSRFFDGVNGTIAPLGLLLDTFAQYLFDGNSIIYQAITLVIILGGLLYLQWKLLIKTLPSFFIAACAFLTCIFMLQSGTYWGEQNMAYHQAIPLFSLLLAIHATLSSNQKTNNLLSIKIFLLGMIAGAAYISGALGTLIIGITWFLLYFLDKNTGKALKKRILNSSISLLISGFICFALQFYFAIYASTRPQPSAFTSPLKNEFWLYMAGEIGRSLGKSYNNSHFEVAIVTILIISIITATIIILYNFFSKKPSNSRFIFVFLAIVSLVFTYLLIISFGRAAHSGAQGTFAIFKAGYERFHFFWATLLFPWIFAAYFLTFKNKNYKNIKLIALYIVIISIIGISESRDVWKVSTFYKGGANFRNEEIAAIVTGLTNNQPISRPNFQFMGMPDLTRAYCYARSINSSFALKIEKMLPKERVSDEQFCKTTPN